MTIEQVKFWVDVIFADYNDELNKNEIEEAKRIVNKSLDAMAINALEQQPCEKAISRKIDEFKVKGKTAEVWIVKGKLQIRCLGVIHNLPLPSVTSKEKTDWIPVSERLPKEHFCDDGFIEPSEYVLIQMRSGCMKVSRYWGSREGYKDCPWIDMRYPTTDEVIAWMPLPEPYKEKVGTKMTKAKLMEYVGKKVYVYFKDGESICGSLGYADDFSAKHDYRKPEYFYIGNTSFKVSHVRKLVESEDVDGNS